MDLRARCNLLLMNLWIVLLAGAAALVWFAPSPWNALPVVAWIVVGLTAAWAILTVRPSLKTRPHKIPDDTHAQLDTVLDLSQIPSTE